MTLSRRQLFATLAAPVVLPVAKLMPKPPVFAPSYAVNPVFDNHLGEFSEVSGIKLAAPTCDGDQLLFCLNDFRACFRAIRGKWYLLCCSHPLPDGWKLNPGCTI